MESKAIAVIILVMCLIFLFLIINKQIKNTKKRKLESMNTVPDYSELLEGKKIQKKIRSVKKKLSILLPGFKSYGLFIDPKDEEIKKIISSFYHNVSQLESLKSETIDSELISSIYWSFVRSFIKLRFFSIFWMIIFSLGLTIIATYFFYFISLTLHHPPSPGENPFSSDSGLSGFFIGLFCGAPAYFGVVEYAKRSGILTSISTITGVPIIIFIIKAIFENEKIAFLLKYISWTFIILSSIISGLLSFIMLFSTSKYTKNEILNLNSKYSERIKKLIA